MKELIENVCNDRVAIIDVLFQCFLDACVLGGFECGIRFDLCVKLLPKDVQLVIGSTRYNRCSGLPTPLWRHDSILEEDCEAVYVERHGLRLFHGIDKY